MQTMESLSISVKSSAFRAVIVNGDAVDTTFPVLSRNRLVDENYWYRTILAKEFMEFFENWLGSGKEREYIKDHAEQTCFLAACRLYGFADREAGD